MSGATLSLIDSDGILIKRYASVDGSVQLGRGPRAKVEHLDLTSGTFRGPGCNVMSSMQARVSWVDDKHAMIEDLDSANGTFVRELGESKLRKLVPHTQYKASLCSPLTSGTQVMFGHSVLRDDGTICSPLTFTACVSPTETVAMPLPPAVPIRRVGPTLSADLKVAGAKNKDTCAQAFKDGSDRLPSDDEDNTVEKDARPRGEQQQRSGRRPGFGLSEQDLIDLETDDGRDDGDRKFEQTNPGVKSASPDLNDNRASFIIRRSPELGSGHASVRLDFKQDGEEKPGPAESELRDLPPSTAQRAPSSARHASVTLLKPIAKASTIDPASRFAMASHSPHFSPPPASQFRLPSPDSPQSKTEDKSLNNFSRTAPKFSIETFILAPADDTSSQNNRRATKFSIDRFMLLKDDDASSQASHLPSPSESVADGELAHLSPRLAKGSFEADESEQNLDGFDLDFDEEDAVDDEEGDNIDVGDIDLDEEDQDMSEEGSANEDEIQTDVDSDPEEGYDLWQEWESEDDEAGVLQEALMDEEPFGKSQVSPSVLSVATDREPTVVKELQQSHSLSPPTIESERKKYLEALEKWSRAEATLAALLKEHDDGTDRRLQVSQSKDECMPEPQAKIRMVDFQNDMSDDSSYQSSSDERSSDQSSSDGRSSDGRWSEGRWSDGRSSYEDSSEFGSDFSDCSSDGHGTDDSTSLVSEVASQSSIIGEGKERDPEHFQKFHVSHGDDDSDGSMSLEDYNKRRHSGQHVSCVKTKGRSLCAQAEKSEPRLAKKSRSKKRTFEDGPGADRVNDRVFTPEEPHDKDRSQDKSVVAAMDGCRHCTDHEGKLASEDRPSKRRRIIKDAIKVSVVFSVGVVSTFFGLAALGSFYADV
ncbi:hypothetical protein OIV83_000496 [Microbotryomycetes sp. JL201]|nr:hypothetical protein OIV83_000496 [Microbotryomycetes sp. JL201]